jgi:DNA end-binding protein Ku
MRPRNPNQYTSTCCTKKTTAASRRGVYCVAEGKQIDRSELVHGLEIQKGKYVSFSTEELKKLETAVSREIEIVQFVPSAEVDPVYFVVSYLLGNGSQSAKAYQLLHSAMKNSGRAAVARFVMRGQQHLALIRPYEHALMLHTLHYADEIRSVKEVSSRTKVQTSELRLAERLIDDLSKDKFNIDDFEDTYRNTILKMARQKAAGNEIEPPAARREAGTVDLMATLKKSLEARTSTPRGEKDAMERPRSKRHGRSERRASHSEKQARMRGQARA